MNVQVKRENLKRDVHQVLSTRPDGISLADLWTEVSREVGYEVKGKDYMVPRLSYFLYLWGGDFKITDNRIYLKDEANSSQATINDGVKDTANQPPGREDDASYSDPYSQYSNVHHHSVQSNIKVTENKPTAMDMFKTAGPAPTTNYQTGKHRKRQRRPQGNYPNPYTSNEAVEGVSYQGAGVMKGYNKQDSTIVNTYPGTHQSMPEKCPQGSETVQVRVDSQYCSLMNIAQNSIAMDLVKRTKPDLKSIGSEVLIEGSCLSEEELTNFRNFIIKNLEGFPSGIKHTKLCIKLNGMQKELKKVTKHWGSFGDFLANQMSDILDVNKAGVVCLIKFLVQDISEEEVIDLTNDSVNEINNENPATGNPFQYYPVANTSYSQQQNFQQYSESSLQNQQGTMVQGSNPEMLQQNNLQRNLSGLGFSGDHADIDVKPIVKKEFDKKEIVIIPLHIPSPYVQPPPDYVDKVARECIEILANADEFVMPERVEKLLFQKFQIHHLRQIGLNHIANLPCIYELNRLLNRIHGYVLGFVKTRPICTLYELEDALTHFIGNIEDFSQLQVGPLQRSPVVFQHFKFPPDQAEIPEITSIDVLEHLRNYMQEQNLWGSRPELEPFMSYLLEQYQADDAYYLGVRIISLPLAAGILKKANYDAMRSRRFVFEYYKDQLKQQVEEAFRKFRASMLQFGDEEEMEVRKHYLNMRPDEVILEIFEKFNNLITNVKMRETSRGSLRKICRVIDEYIYLLRDNPMCQSMFHMSICMSNTEIDETVVAMLNPTTQNVVEKTTVDVPPSINIKPPPRKDKLIELVKVYIDRCLNAGPISLTHLDRIEEKLLEEFDFADFHFMGYGRFIQFLITENKQTLEEVGGLIMGSSGSQEGAFKPELHAIQEFIKQCKICGIIKPEEVENILCKHFGVKELRHLGNGNINRLLSHADKHRQGTYSDFTVFYQSTLTKPSCIPGQNLKVGVLGHQSRDLAKICLHNCPLLEDLGVWSQWGLVFEPELGKLKDFVQKYGGVTNKHLDGGRLTSLDFLALETKPGVLLKIVSNTSSGLVAEAVGNQDVNKFCGQLVSLVVAFKGVRNLPKALLAGHVKTALLQLHAADPQSLTPGAPFISQDSASKFVLQCLLRIPKQICVDIADDIFLSPLGQVVGSTKFKQLLVQLCTSIDEINHLAELGCILGIQEWTNSISQKCILADSSIQSITQEVDKLYEVEHQGQIGDEAEDDDEDDDELEDLDDILNDANNADRLHVNLKVKVKDDQACEVKVNEDGNEGHSARKGTLVPKEAEAMETSHEEIKVRTCEEIVNEIRKDEFGVGIQLSEDGQRLMKIQQERLGRSLDRLSKDLYSKDTHFVLELVQNADDNSYHDDLLNNTNDLCPAVKFVIDEDSVCVRNNELGFQEQNIRALCDVGRSTKGKHKFGYIGQKGIGFKSVYRVSDTPEIHSNGYHVKFDVNSGPMGYILPHWWTKSNKADESWETNIILTLKPDMKQQARTLAARFNDLHPSLLLFLHRLREITIDNKVENSVQTMKRRDIGDNIIEIQHTRGLDCWLITKKMLDASQISSQIKSGTDVESTEIALAFPLKPSEQKLNMHQLPPKQLVFAFLPLRSYGFRFIVQGDFDVPSSREDVDRDSSWNQWLRNEIHTLFLDSLDMFKSHKEFNHIEAVVSFLQFVPMEDEVLDFFKPVASDIFKKLKARPCVPTQPNSQGTVSWKIPSQTVRVQDPLVRSVITADLLQTHLNLHYLHPDVASMLNPTLTSCLGIETLTTDHLYQLGKALIVDMDGHCESPDQIELISKWLACMYRSSDEFHHDDTIQTSLLSLAMLPLRDGKLVSLQANTVFIPMIASHGGNSSELDLIKHIEDDLNCLHPLLIKTNDDEINGQVHKLLTRLGVKQLSPFDVINHHIIPVFKSQLWKEKSEATLVSYLTYIKAQTDRQNTVCNIEELKDIVKIVTNKGLKTPAEVPVHFSKLYASSVNLQQTFPGYDWTVVDPVYLPPQSSHQMALSWHHFFIKLGVEEFFFMQKREVHLRKEDLATSSWRSVFDTWPQEETEYIIQDYYCEELESLVKHNVYPSGESFQVQMRDLCLCLENLWDSQFSKYTKTHVCDKNSKVLMETETSFSILLHTSCWLPAVVCKCIVEADGSVTQSRTTEMMEPDCLYIQSEALDKLVFDKVPYLNVNLALNSSFTQFMSLKNHVTIETLKDFLLQWCARLESDVPTVFCTSLSHIKQVYKYLSNQLNRGELQNLLLHHSIFFVPSKLSGQDEVVAGKMMGRKEIWLGDKTGLFDKHKGLLEEFHSEISKKRTISSFYSDSPELVHVFRQEGKIDQQPQVEEYIELLSLLCSSSTPKDVAVLMDVLYIFTTIGQIISHPLDAQDDATTAIVLESMKATVKRKMQKEKVFPTKKGVWVSLNDNPLISDNRDLEKMFYNKNNVHFLYLDAKDEEKEHLSKGKGQRLAAGQKNSRIHPSMIEVFIGVCGVKKLSECIAMEVIPSLTEVCLGLQEYFHQIIPILQQYLMSRFQDVYKELELYNARKMLKNAKFYQTKKIEATYRLAILDVHEIREEKCVISLPSVYIHVNHVHSISEINKELARYFSRGNIGCINALRSFLSELYNTQKGLMDDTVHSLLQRHEADDITIPEYDAWQVAPPVFLQPAEPELPEEHPFLYTDNQQYGYRNGSVGRKAWPPTSSESNSRSTGSERGNQPTSTIWPSSQTKDYMKSVKDLPSNVRIAGPGEIQQGSETISSTCDDITDSKVKHAIPDESVDDSQGLVGGHGNKETVPGNDTNSRDSSAVTRKRKLLDTETTEEEDQINKKMYTCTYRTGGETDTMLEINQNITMENTSESTENAEVDKSVKNRPKNYSSDVAGQFLLSDRRTSYIKGDPVWTKGASDYTLDQLASGLELPGVVTLTEGAGDPEIGRWGENLVAGYLQQQKEAGNIIDFLWNNDENETGAPYDFVVQFTDKFGTREDFIEVKSTTSNDKEMFEISVQQIKFAEEKKEHFHIYRVFNAGNPDKVRLARIFDLNLRLSQKQVKLCLII